MDATTASGLSVLLHEPVHWGPVDLDARRELLPRWLRSATSLISAPLGEHDPAGVLLAFAEDHADELGLSEVTFLHTATNIAAAGIHRRRAEQELRHESRHDALTGLPNRKHLLYRLDSALNRRQSAGGDVAIVYVDLDNFKLVNDTRGHAVGDRLLQLAAQRLRKIVRNDDTVARIGGDEFVLLCEHLPNRAAISAIADRVRSAIAEPFEIFGTPAHISASVGVAFADPSTGIDGILAQADAAMYREKTNRRRAGLATSSEPSQDR